MASPLQGSIAAKIGSAFSSLFYAATLVRTTNEVPSGQPSWDKSGTPTTTSYTCKGIVEEYSDYAKANSLVNAEDRKVLILATSLAVTPTDQDKVTIGGKTYRVIEAKTDPATAVWELRCRV